MVQRRGIGQSGVSLGFGAYFLWGLFPLYFKLLSRSGAFEVVAYRITCCLLFCVLVVAVTRGWRQIGEVLHNRRAVVVLAGAGLLVSLNWTLYVWGVNNGHAIDASLGYFINPLMSAALGVVLLGEKMRRAQWVAFAISALAVVALVVGYGNVPWVALGLASTFALYGLMKKKVGTGVPALPGLAIETSAATPFALGYLIVSGCRRSQYSSSGRLRSSDRVGRTGDSDPVAALRVGVGKGAAEHHGHLAICLPDPAVLDRLADLR